MTARIPRRKKKKTQPVDYAGWVLLAFQLSPIFERSSHHEALDSLDRLMIAMRSGDYDLAKQYLPSINDVMETFLLGDEWANELLLRYASLHDELKQICTIRQLGFFDGCTGDSYD